MLNPRAVIVSFKVKAIILERFGSFKNLQGRSFQKQGHCDIRNLNKVKPRITQ